MATNSSKLINELSGLNLKKTLNDSGYSDIYKDIEKKVAPIVKRLDDSSKELKDINEANAKVREIIGKELSEMMKQATSVSELTKLFESLKNGINSEHKKLNEQSKLASAQFKDNAITREEYNRRIQRLNEQRKINSEKYNSIVEAENELTEKARKKAYSEFRKDEINPTKEQMEEKSSSYDVKSLIDDDNKETPEGSTLFSSFSKVVKNISGDESASVGVQTTTQKSFKEAFSGALKSEFGDFSGEGGFGNFFKSGLAESIAGEGMQGGLANSLSEAMGGSWGMIISLIAKGVDIATGINTQIEKWVNSTFDKAIDNAISNANSYMGKINSRLEGLATETTNYYKNIADNLGNTLLLSAYIDQEEYLKNVNELVEKGIADDLEDKAMLMTIGDKVLDKFDVMNDNVLSLIRIQQQDITRAQFGTESKINQLLNTLFADTQYINDVYNSVASTVYEANTLMNSEELTNWDYTLQKWMGSLYEMGMSSSTISNIANGLNLLATGDVTQLTSNTSLNTLLAMITAKSGMSYADLLTGGIDADELNDLLKTMVTYLQDISDNTNENNVLKSAFSDVFGLSISDFTAVTNLSDQYINSIYASTINGVEGAEATLQEQIEKIDERTTLQEKISTMLNNYVYSVGEQIADSDVYLIEYTLSKKIAEFADSSGLYDAISAAIPIFNIGDALSGLVEQSITGMSTKVIEAAMKQVQAEFSGNTGSWYDDVETVVSTITDFIASGDPILGTIAQLTNEFRWIASVLTAEGNAARYAGLGLSELTVEDGLSSIMFDWETNASKLQSTTITSAEEEQSKTDSENLSSINDTVSDIFDTLSTSSIGSSTNNYTYYIYNSDGSVETIESDHDITSEIESTYKVQGLQN